MARSMSSKLAPLRASIQHGRDKLLPNGEAVTSIAAVDMLLHNWHLGITSFGGPTVHFQIFHTLFVVKYGWLDEQTYQEMFALCQALCGPGSTKMHYAINTLHYGFWTGVLAFLLWSLPMAIVAFGVSLGVANIGEQMPGPAYALLSGLNSATVGIIALAAVQLSNKAITDTWTRILVFFGGAAGMLYNALWYFPVLMAAGGLTTIIWDLKVLQRLCRAYSRRRPASDEEVQAQDIPMEERASRKAPESVQNLQATRQSSSSRRSRPEHTDSFEPPTTSTDSSQPSALLYSWKTGVIVLTTFFAAFAIFMTIRGVKSGVSRGFDIFANLFLAGTIIFGGGPVVIPLLREYVVAPGWVSPRDFLLGLAITQSFPGPNFNFAVFLGSLAVSGTSVPRAAGALIAYLAIFTPGLWLHTGMMGVWASIRKVQAVRACLRGVHAVAVGLVFTAVYRLFQIGYLDADVQGGGSLARDPWWVVIVATSFVGGRHFKLSPPMAIVLGAVMGLMWYGVVRADT